MHEFRRWLSKFFSEIDRKDIFYFGGLALLCYGFYKIDPALAFIIGGLGFAGLPFFRLH